MEAGGFETDGDVERDYPNSRPNTIFTTKPHDTANDSSKLSENVVISYARFPSSQVDFGI